MAETGASATGSSLVHVPKTAEVVASALRRQIVTGEVAEGQPLPSEAELMERFGVSRPSLREALRILESEMLITVRRGAHGGARACRPAISVAANYLGLLMQMEGVQLADVYLARIEIEPAAVEMLAKARGRAAAVQELRSLLEIEAALGDDAAAYIATTTRFHQRLVELAGNRTLALLWGMLHQVLAGEVLDTNADRRPTAERVKKRFEVVSKALDLIAAGEAAAARDLWREEMIKAGKHVLRRHGRKTVVDILG